MMGMVMCHVVGPQDWIKRWNLWLFFSWLPTKYASIIVVSLYLFMFSWMSAVFENVRSINKKLRKANLTILTAFRNSRGGAEVCGFTCDDERQKSSSPSVRQWRMRTPSRLWSTQFRGNQGSSGPADNWERWWRMRHLYLRVQGGGAATLLWLHTLFGSIWNTRIIPSDWGRKKVS